MMPPGPVGTPMRCPSPYAMAHSPRVPRQKILRPPGSRAGRQGRYDGQPGGDEDHVTPGAWDIWSSPRHTGPVGSRIVSLGAGAHCVHPRAIERREASYENRGDSGGGSRRRNDTARAGRSGSTSTGRNTVSAKSVTVGVEDTTPPHRSREMSWLPAPWSSKKQRPTARTSTAKAAAVACQGPCHSPKSVVHESRPRSVRAITLPSATGPSGRS